MENRTELEKSYFEGIKNGTSVLADGYFIRDNKLWFIDPKSLGMIKPKWNSTYEEWVESASQIEIDAVEHKRRTTEYENELEVASIFMKEYQFGINGTESDFQQVRNYLISIRPDTKTLSIQARPEILFQYDKYVESGNNGI